MRFHKYEGLGNDFVIVEQLVTPEQARAICDRHLGVGADGVLMVRRTPPKMSVINSDGSRPQMCGNGLRCVARHLGIGEEPVLVQTDAGPHLCSEIAGDIEVAMAVPSLKPADLPIDSKIPIIDDYLLVDGREVEMTCVSMGNPHAVIFDEAIFDDDALKRTLGPAIGSDSFFPEGVNVGFAKKTEDGFLLEVFERGAGWTRACGTGACAAAVAAVETKRAERHQEIAIHLPGGTLTIIVGHPGEVVQMRGPARHVFSGDLA